MQARIVAPSVSFDPAAFGTLDVYFDALSLGLANGANVTTWPDLSGNGRNFTTSHGTPTFVQSGIGTGRAAVNLPANARMVTPAFQQFPALAGTVIMLSAPTVLAANRQLLGTFDQASPNWLWYQTNSTVNKGFMGGNFWNARMHADYINAPRVQVWRRNGATLTFFDRNERRNITITNSQQSSAALWLGAASNGAAAQVSCVIAYREALSDDVVIQIRNQLIRRYFGRDSINLSCCGDSITAGFIAGSIPYPVLMEPVAGFHHIVENFGVSGDSIAQQASRAPTGADVQHAQSGGRSVFVGFVGSNDINVGTSGTSAYNQYRDFFLARPHRRKVAVTMLKRVEFNQFPAREAERQIYNSLLRANWQTFADALADVDANPLLQDPTNTTYFPDGVHPGTVGNQEMANIIGAAVASLT